MRSELSFNHLGPICMRSGFPSPLVAAGTHNTKETSHTSSCVSAKHFGEGQPSACRV